MRVSDPGSRADNAELSFQSGFGALPGAPPSRSKIYVREESRGERKVYMRGWSDSVRDAPELPIQLLIRLYVRE